MDQVKTGSSITSPTCWSACGRARTPQTDIEIGHRTSSACLLGNVALRSKERIVWDVANQRLIGGSPAAQKLLSREYRAPWKLVV